MVENFITNSWTVGVVFLDASGGTNSPQQTARNGYIQQQQYQRKLVRSDRRPAIGRFVSGAGHYQSEEFQGNWYGTTHRWSPPPTAPNRVMLPRYRSHTAERQQLPAASLISPAGLGKLPVPAAAAERRGHEYRDDTGRGPLDSRV